MDILFYSNYCKHCEKIKKFITKHGFIHQVNAICIDNRIKNPQTGQYIIKLEDGKQMMLPPNIHEVPSLLVKHKYNVILGDEIIRHFQPTENHTVEEPLGFELTNTMSDKFTSYSDPTQSFNPSNFANANHDIAPIRAEPETYRPNKLSPDVTIDKIHNHRSDDIKKLNNEEMNSMIQQMNQTREMDKQQILTDYSMAPK